MQFFLHPLWCKSMQSVLTLFVKEIQIAIKFISQNKGFPAPHCLLCSDEPDLVQANAGEHLENKLN